MNRLEGAIYWLSSYIQRKEVIKLHYWTAGFSFFYLSTKIPACTAWTMLLNLGFSSGRRLATPVFRLKVHASQSRTSLGTDSTCRSLSSSSVSSRRLVDRETCAVKPVRPGPTRYDPVRTLRPPGLICVNRIQHGGSQLDVPAQFLKVDDPPVHLLQDPLQPDETDWISEMKHSGSQPVLPTQSHRKHHQVTSRERRRCNPSVGVSSWSARRFGVLRALRRTRSLIWDAAYVSLQGVPVFVVHTHTARLSLHTTEEEAKICFLQRDTQHSAPSGNS